MDDQLFAIEELLTSRKAAKLLLNSLACGDFRGNGSVLTNLLIYLVIGEGKLLADELLEVVESLLL